MKRLQILLTSAAVLLGCGFSALARADSGASLRTGMPVENALQVPLETALQPVGEARLRKFGFHIYDASTWARERPLPANGRVQGPFVLQLVYARSIDAEDLVETTREIWQDLALHDDDAERWLSQLGGLWPDIRRGDCLALHIDEQGRSRFWFNGAPLGTIDEPEFGERFVAIWLHPDSPEPDLRWQLLGQATP